MELSFPPIFLLPYRLSEDEQSNLEGRIPSLTYDIHEARVVLGRVSTKERARYELHHLKLLTESAPPASHEGGYRSEEEGPRKKRIRLSPPLGAGDEPRPSRPEDADERGSDLVLRRDNAESYPAGRLVEVVKLGWFTDSIEEGRVLPLDKYVLYRGLVVGSREPPYSRTQATADVQGNTKTGPVEDHTVLLPQFVPLIVPRRPALLQQTTSEHDAITEFPELPVYLTTTYSCQRPTPAHTPNDDFIGLLKSIRMYRKLRDDETGERAYSTAIASIAAYPYQITTSHELNRLPGCGNKIVGLYQEWEATGTLTDIEAAKTSPGMAAIELFYQIWGVGGVLARKFHKQGWTDLDDVVEHGWSDLSRVQQIGVKYYDDFLIPIPRAEVEQIGNTILRHAQNIDPGFQLTIVGGYRRGKEQSGDVDVVISHRDESATLNFVNMLVVSLEKSGYITHTLLMSLHNSQRGQRPVSWKGNAGGRTGFDTLDKAMVVWKSPESDEPRMAKEGVPRTPHRRVDIIVSPWKTVGCAVLGWSGDTTFQRDLRRYCKNVKGLKFDSSGIRSRTDGAWVDLEEGGELGPALDMVTAEKRVFEGLGLVWRLPEERCTG
ncbi:hypothetical protein F5X68DRAFT_176072 [Plectosphaerella plurivora]|uniref:DNA polymerase n=1 Tax=Plectosphaerella plurivora TaxID=936078 RepID=A0A9P8V379_9PEZI|nr:hypothetical protein F5X68DRAFT_176072 [Plectosphaerella plurivora]